MEKNLLLKISSNYNLKTIFSYEDYKFVLRLIKYNKAIQDKIEITQAHYKDQQDNFKYIQKYEYTYNQYTIKDFFDQNDHIFFFVFVVYIILYGLALTKIKVIYYIVFVFIFLGLELFYKISEEIAKKVDIIGAKSTLLNILISLLLPIGLPKIITLIDFGNNQNSLKIIKYVNLNIISLFLLNAGYGFITYYPELYPYLKLKLFIVIISIIFDCSYEIAIIYRNYLLFKIKEFDWDYYYLDMFFLFFNHFSIALKIYIFLFLLDIIEQLRSFTIYLLEYKNIRINKYILPNDFLKMKNKSSFLFSKVKEFIAKHHYDEYELFNFINQLRKKNKVKMLLLDEHLPDFIVKELSEAMFESYKNIFKLGKEKYLFKYKFGEFKKNAEENKNILIKDNFNRINIVIRNEIEYVLIYED